MARQAIIQRLFPPDHKAIGLQYAITSAVFVLLGLAAAMAPPLPGQLGETHAAVLTFLGAVSLAVGGFGGYLIPLQIGASDAAFPRLSRLGLWMFATGGGIMAASLFAAAPAASAPTWWLAGLLLVITSVLFACVNGTVTIVQMRAPGMTFMRLPFLVWAQLVTAFLLLLAFPPLASAVFMQLMDLVCGTRLVRPEWAMAGWSLAQPAVYVLMLPALGIVAEVLPAHIRRPLWGYRLLVYAVIFLGAMSGLVWAHHLVLTAAGATTSPLFRTAARMALSIPPVVIVTALIVSLYGGSIRFTTAGLFALACLPMWGIGVFHFPGLLTSATVFAFCAGVYHWFPKVSGRRMNETLGLVHFFGSVLLVLLFPDGRVAASGGGWLPGLVLAVFIANLVLSWPRGTRAGDNPWEATTLEWTTASPPPRENFTVPVSVVRGAYGYAAGGTGRGFSPQGQPLESLGRTDFTVAARPDTATNNVALGMWLFLMSEAMLFGALFSAYALLRVSAIDRPPAVSPGPTIANTVLLAVIAVFIARARRKAATGPPLTATRRELAFSAVLGGAFVTLKASEHLSKLSFGLGPSTSAFYWLYFLLTGLHALHVLGGAIAAGYLAAAGARSTGGDVRRFANRVGVMAMYWYFVDLVWLVLVVLFYRS